MVLVRMVFHAKLGQGAQVLAGMKAMAAQMQSASHVRHLRILTDLSGRFDTIVQEMEYETIDTFLQELAEMDAPSGDQPAGDEWMAMMEGGYKEYYTIEFEQ